MLSDSRPNSNFGGKEHRAGVLPNMRIDDFEERDHMDVEVHVTTVPPSSQSLTRSSLRNDEASATSLSFRSADVTPPKISSFTIPGCVSSLRICVANAVEVFHFSLSEPGMALLTASMLVVLSCLGVVTLLFVVPPMTTGVARDMQEALEAALLERYESTASSSWVPEVISVVHGRLQLLLLPSLLVGVAGVWVLMNTERRKPGRMLLSYGVGALSLGIILLGMLLHIFVRGQLNTWQVETQKNLQRVTELLHSVGGECTWSSRFPCTGLTTCCVTNTSTLDVSAAALLGNDTVWRSFCFLTMPNETSIARRRVHGFADTLVDVSEQVRAQCGLMSAIFDTDPHVPLNSTACGLEKSSPPEVGLRHAMTPCEDFFLGHFASSLGFSLYLILGMGVSSLVSGMVALTTYQQRPQTSEFQPVNAPSTAVREKSMKKRTDAKSEMQTKGY